MANAVIVIPAYNEEKLIGKVLESCLAAKKQGLVREVVVVNDGSTDKTAEVAAKAGARVISTGRRGKGEAVYEGIKECKKMKAEIMLTLDADLLNLHKNHIRQLIGKVSKPGKSMAVMEVWEGKAKESLDKCVKESGQRAIKLSALNFLFIEGKGGKLPKGASRFLSLSSRYGLERALNHTIPKKNTVLIEPTQELFARKPFHHSPRSQIRCVTKTREAIKRRKMKADKLRGLLNARRGAGAVSKKHSKPR